MLKTLIYSFRFNNLITHLPKLKKHSNRCCVSISVTDTVFTSGCCSDACCHLQIYYLLKTDIMVHEYINVTMIYNSACLSDDTRAGRIGIYATVCIAPFACSIVNKSASDQVLKAVEEALQKFPFSYQGARILSGQEEGAFGWVTVNYLDDRLTQVSWCCCRQTGSKNIYMSTWFSLRVLVGKWSQCRDLA